MLHQSGSQAAQAHLGWLCGWASSTQRYWAPLPSLFLTKFSLTLSFAFCFLPQLADVFLLCYSSLLFSFSPHPLSPSPFTILSTEASENKLSLGLPAALLLCERVSATWQSLKVHVPNCATLFFSHPELPKHSCAELGGIHFCFCWLFSLLNREIEWLIIFTYSTWKLHLSSFHSLDDTVLSCVSIRNHTVKQWVKLFVWIRVKLN